MTAEFQGFILSLSSIKDNYESLYVVYPPEGNTYIHGSLLCQDAAGKLVVYKAIS